VTILLIAFCAAGMKDNALEHNSYTGYGIVIFLPLAVLVILGQVALALIVSLSHS
jgi:hypothetical protein